jgi:hypothetical protein
LFQMWYIRVTVSGCLAYTGSFDMAAMWAAIDVYCCTYKGLPISFCNEKRAIDGVRSVDHQCSFRTRHNAGMVGCSLLR